MRIYNVTGVKVSTPAASLPVTLQEVKDYCKLEGSSEDDFLTMLIEAATEIAEGYMQRKIVTQTLQASFDYVPIGRSAYYTINQYVPYYDYAKSGSSFFLPFPTIQSISSIKFYDTANAETTYSATNYFLDDINGRVVFNQGYADAGNLREKNAMLVTYVAGFSTVPSAIKIGVLEQVKVMYECRGVCDMCEGMGKALSRYRLIDMLGY